MLTEPEVPKLSDEQQRAVDTIVSGSNVLLTGPGGVGKTYTLNQGLSQVQRRYRITASTGIAASHLDGCTIHSFLGSQIAGNPTDAAKILTKMPHYIQRALRIRLDGVDTLIIDEVSMLSGDYIDMIDYWLRQFLDKTKPFGGVQAIFSGDFLQLPPVDKGGIKNLFAFSAEVWKSADVQTCQLTKSFRQSDQHFVDVLTDLRFGVFSERLRDLLAGLVGRKLEEPTVLVGKNDTAFNINSVKLKRLSQDTKKEIYQCGAKFHGETYHVEKLKKQVIADEVLNLCIGAPVIILKNDTWGRYVNGTKAIIKHVDANFVTVDIDGEDVDLVEAEWHLKDGDDRILATMVQFPIKLAWAITMHKSQGMTLDNLRIMNIDGEIFSPGQLYVGLSRARNLEGVSIAIEVTPRQVRADGRAVKFYKDLA